MHNWSSRLLCLVLGTALGLLAPGCAARPAADEAAAALRAAISESVPQGWVHGFAHGKVENVQLIEIADWGAFDRETKSWPVQVHFVGSVSFTTDATSTKRSVRAADEVTEFRLRKNEFGEWIAEH